MLHEISSTYVYERALSACRTPPYASLNLPHIIKTVGDALQMVHAGGFFKEYTRHGPEHSVALVHSLEWLITDHQRERLTDGDFLFLLLACLLHDMGMIVNADDFSKQNPDEIGRFVTRLQGDVNGKEFLASIPENYKYREELIYEEFIRHHHARRISAALMDSPDSTIGETARIADVLRPLFEGISGKPLSDLALICESHHNSDLHDLKKYPTRSVHGQTAQAQISVHAVSILLRAADVLQIGTGRTPSVAFSLVSPSNPISYLHWVKEMGVNRVTGEVVRNSDPAVAADQYKVKLYGFFKEAEPFFALMNHVRYATSELRRCVDWSAHAASSQDDFRFRWSTIDTADVEAHGFEREQFSFQVDREKILNLLIGHTLYNDTRVVLRELVQNSIDATRLYEFENKGSGGHVHAEINSRERKLCITDSGTGMTPATIVKHLLTVGSSFYSTEEFGRAYPEFASISRFGIGILTSFMVADEIEILTSHPSEEYARRISINGPSGTYLIKLIEKRDLTTAFNGRGHGTAVTLTIRANSKPIRLVREMQHWFGFPNCKLTAKEDEGDTVDIGYKHPYDMLQEWLSRYVDRNALATRYSSFEVIRQDDADLFDAAYVVRISKYSGRRSIVQTGEFARRKVEDIDVNSLAGIFLQGVRVESGSAGFRERGPLAVVNGKGRSAPRTNVARSGIEKGDLARRFLSAIYGTYIKFARENGISSHLKSSVSITRDGRYAFYALRQFDMSQAADGELLQSALDGEKALVIESAGERKLISRDEFLENSKFVTIDSPFYRHAEALIEEISHTKSLNDIIKALDLKDSPLPGGVLLCAPSLHLDKREMETLSVERLDFTKSPEQLVVTWQRVSTSRDDEMLLRFFTRRNQEIPGLPIILVREDALTDPESWPKDTALMTDYCVFIHPKSTVAENLLKYLGDEDTTELSKAERSAVAQSIGHYLSRDSYHRGRSIDDMAREYSQRQAGASFDMIRRALTPFQNLQILKVGEEEFNGYF